MHLSWTLLTILSFKLNFKVIKANNYFFTSDTTSTITIQYTDKIIFIIEIIIAKTGNGKRQNNIVLHISGSCVDSNPEKPIQPLVHKA